MWTNSLQHSFILEGKKAEFYLEITQNSVKDLLDRVSDFGWDINQEDNLGSITGCVIFDNATVKQKVYLIHLVLNALLNSSIATFLIKTMNLGVWKNVKNIIKKN